MSFAPFTLYCLEEVGDNMGKNTLESSIVKTHGKTIWKKFIKNMENYQLLSNQDQLRVWVDTRMESLLMGKLLTMVRDYQMCSIELEILAHSQNSREREYLEDMGERLGITIASYHQEMEEPECSARTKIAQAEGFDDCVVELLYSMLYEGRIQGILPKSVSGTSVTIIRPMYLMRHKDIMDWAREQNLPLYQGREAFQTEEHQKLYELVVELEEKNTAVASNVFGSIDNVSLRKVVGYWKDGSHHHYLEEY